MWVKLQHLFLSHTYNWIDKQIGDQTSFFKSLCSSESFTTCSCWCSNSWRDVCNDTFSASVKSMSVLQLELGPFKKTLAVYIYRSFVIMELFSNLNACSVSAHWFVPRMSILHSNKSAEQPLFWFTTKSKEKMVFVGFHRDPYTNTATQWSMKSQAPIENTPVQWTTLLWPGLFPQ